MGFLTWDDRGAPLLFLPRRLASRLGPLVQRPRPSLRALHAQLLALGQGAHE